MDLPINERFMGDLRGDAFRPSLALPTQSPRAVAPRQGSEFQGFGEYVGPWRARKLPKCPSPGGAEMRPARAARAAVGSLLMSERLSHLGN